MGCKPIRRTRYYKSGNKDEITFEVKPGEPVFILIGSDIVAAGTIREWARSAEARGAPDFKTEDARNIADEFDRWEPKKVPD